MTNEIETPAETPLEAKQQPALSVTKQVTQARRHLRTIKGSVRDWLEERNLNPIMELARLARQAERLGSLDLAIRAWSEIAKFGFPRLSTVQVTATKTSHTSSTVMHSIMLDPTMAKASEALALGMAAEKRKQLQSPLPIDIEAQPLPLTDSPEESEPRWRD
jgi:hypothetical protein